METGRAGTRNLAEKAMEMIPISRITVMTGAILLALSGPVRADYQAGVDAFEARDYSQALDELLPIAKQGHVEAQTLLGTLFRTGLVGNQDFITAEMWFLEAAAQDDPSAHYNLGMMYFQNEKMPPGVHDKVEAARAGGDMAVLRSVERTLTLEQTKYERLKQDLSVAELELENTLVVVMLLHFQMVVLVEQGLQELLQEHQLPHVMELLIEVEEVEVQDQVVAVVDQVVQV